MRRWLAVSGLAWCLSAPVQAQNKGLLTTDIAGVARNHVLDLRVAQQHGSEHPLPLIRGLVVSKSVSTNAFVGVGLADMYGRKKGGLRLGEAPVRSRKPAVTFVMKF